MPSGTTHFGNVTLSGNLAVTGTTAFTGAQTFTGAATFAAAVSVGTTLAVTGAVTLAAGITVGTTLAVTGATTLTGALTANGGTTIKAGTGTGTYAALGVLQISSTQVATGANTTETDVHSYTFPANSMSANGKALRFRVWGTTAANANNKTFKFYFGGTAYYTTGAVAANAKDFCLVMTVIRTGAATQKIFFDGHFNGSAIVASTVTTGNKDLTTDLTVKATITNGSASASDITVEGSTIEFLA